jgi:acetolactate synthase-1/2/3 large subunit
MSHFRHNPILMVKEMTLSDLIVRYLEQLGVEYVFSVPGSPISPLYDALLRSEKRGGPRSVLSRHEAGGAFMADGYARETGKIGVCCSTTGPGATNLITGLASAHAEHIPLLAITPQTTLKDFGFGAFQESSADVTDIVGMFQYCTRYNTLISHANQLERKLAAALTKAFQHPKGPVHLSIPVDILRTSWKGDISFPNLERLLDRPESMIDLEALERLSGKLEDILREKRRVVVMVGHDCGGASEEIVRFAEIFDAQIVTTQRGKSWIDPYHPLARGVFGFAGHMSAREALTDKSVGLVLATGISLNEWSTGGWNHNLLNERLVHIHNTESYFHRSPHACLQICGTISRIFQELVLRFEKVIPEVRSDSAYTPSQQRPYVPSQIKVQSSEESWGKNGTGPIKPQKVIRDIVQRVPPETRFLIDNSNSVPWSIHYFFSQQPENYHLSIGFASMGWAIGASVGMSLANRNSPVICFTGDGCFLMSGQEITVAVAERLPVIFVVLNDQAYGMIKHAHRLTGTEDIDLSIPRVDFSMMAESVGAMTYTIRNDKDLAQIDFQTLCERDGPTLLDVHIDPEEAPPLGMF